MRILVALPCLHLLACITTHISTYPLQDFVADIADLCPEYCVGSIIHDLLQSDSPDAQLIGLRSLHLVATSVPQDMAAALDLRASRLKRSTTLGLGGSTSSSASSNLGGAGSSNGSRRMVQVGQPCAGCESAFFQH